MWFFLLLRSYLIDLSVQFPYLHSISHLVVSQSFENGHSQCMVGLFHFQHVDSPLSFFFFWYPLEYKWVLCYNSLFHLCFLPVLSLEEKLVSSYHSLICQFRYSYNLFCYAVETPFDENLRFYPYCQLKSDSDFSDKTYSIH